MGIKITSKWLTNLQSLHENTANYVHSSIYGRNRSFQIMSYRSGFGGPKPVEMGKEYEVEITEISNRGDGIARVQGFVIFVAGGKVGQNVKIRITSIGERFAKAEVV